MQYESIIGNFYDLLDYHGSGTYQSLSRSFQAVLRHFELLDFYPQQITKYRKQAVYFLNSIGLIEIDYQRNSWMTCPSFLVKKDPLRIIGIGGSIFINQLNTEVQKINTFEISSFDNGYKPYDIPRNIEFYPQFLNMKLSSSNAKNITSKLKCNLLNIPSLSIANVLPRLNEVADSIKNEIDGGSGMFETAIEKFSFDDQIKPWHSINNQFPLEPALYRKERFDKRGFNYYVQSSNKFNLQLFQIKNPDWSILLGLFLTEKTISLLYDQLNLKLYVPKCIRFPILINRLLIACSFMEPSKIEKKLYRTYHAIDDNIIKFIEEKFPIFTIERITS